MEKMIIPFCCARERVVSESAPAGEAQAALNVRSGGAGTLLVCGVPTAVGVIGANERLILSDGDDRLLTLQGNEVHYAGSTVATLSGNFLSAHRVGQLVVVVTTEGLTALLRTTDSYTPLTVADAVPDIGLTAQTAAPLSASVDSVAFADGYTTWAAPLDETDVGHVCAALRQAWQSLTTQARAAGIHTAPLRARIGVRLYDDTYLYLSDPVTVGADTMANATPLRADVTISGDRYTGTEAVTLTLAGYTLSVAVTSGVASAWRPIVKAVDVLVTDEVAVVADTSSLTYRCLTASGGSRRAMLEFGFVARSLAEVTALLARQGWRVAATCSDLDALDGHVWSADAEPPARSFTAAEVAAMAERQRATDRPTAAMVLAGRLHHTTADGYMVVSAPGNPLVAEQRRLIGGGGLRGLAAAPRTLYSSGFGRYPAFVFSDEGVFALPLTGSTAAYGEPRLVSRAVLATGSKPAEGGKSIYFATERGQLCRLHGNDLTVLLTGVTVSSLAYDTGYDELYALLGDGRLLAFGSDDAYSERTFGPSVRQLHGTVQQALAVTTDGTVLDLTREQSAAARPFAYRSQWIALAPQGGSNRLSRPRWMVWDLLGSGVEATLTLRGALGSGEPSALLSVLTVCGDPATPTATPVPAAPWRLVQLEAGGTAHSGTRLAATIGR